MTLDLRKYRRIVVLTGAGVSVASGLPTYRGEGGVWEKHNVEAFGHASSLERHPERTWQLFGPMRGAIARAEPNAAHLALAHVEARLGSHQDFLLVTQNVDGLHQRAGSRRVVELHGSLARTRCADAECTFTPYEDREEHVDAVPRCPVCQGILRPDVVLFGEALPAMASWQSKRALRDCDLFIAVGTSGTVSPAADFVRSAHYAGARTIYVNLEPLAPPNPAFQETVLGRAEDTLPTLLTMAA
ncbi:MAG: NAD-dependent deacylase [Steroidobacteraceae bacterium]